MSLGGVLGGAGKGGGAPGSSADLNFATGQYFGGSLASMITNTNSTGGYVTNADGSLTLVAANTPRVGVGTGLLVEPLGQNNAVWTQQFSNPAWVQTSATATDNTTVGPDGTTTAATLNIAASGAASINETFGYVTFSASIYVKPGTKSIFYFQINANSAPTIGAFAQFFNLSTGTVGSTQTLIAGYTGISATITPAANGFFRCYVTWANPGGTTATQIFIGGADADNSRTVGTGTMFLWGAQVGVSGFDAGTSYIPALGVAGAQRAADNIVISGALATALAGSTGTIVANTNKSKQSVAATLIDANGTVLLGKTAANLGTTAVGAALSTGNTGTWTGANDLGLAWNASGGAIQLNGGTIVTDATARTPSATFHLGSTSGSSAFFNGYFTRLTAYTTKQASPQ